MYSRELINTLERDRRLIITKRMSKKKARKNPKNQPVESFKHIEFTWEDCVRSPLVKEYLMIKEELSKSK